MGEFRIVIRSREMKPPTADWYGNLRATSQLVYLVDDQYSEGDYRRSVATGHRYLTVEGRVAASGKLDPKQKVVGEIEYRQMGKNADQCDLCVDDPIPIEERFRGSVYRP